MSHAYRASRPQTTRKRYPNQGYSNKPKANRGKTEYINPSKFIQVASASESEAYVPTHVFEDFQLEPLLKRNLLEMGYITPSPIQDQAIAAGLEGRDIIGIASTGTGKTAAFALPVLQQLITDSASYALIIAPTRELAQQIEQECKTLAKGSGLFGTVLIGGTGMAGQLHDLRRSPRIVIGTPGRIKDHLERGSLKLSRFNMIVLDEVDRMLDMGFVRDVTTILSKASAQRQSFFFSATMDAKVRTLLDTFTTDPLMISLKGSSASEHVHQDVVRYQTSSDKIDKLHDLLIKQEVAKAIVFDETQRGVERLSKELVSRGFAAESIHGGKSQGQRQRALAKFKGNQVNILVATDVAARGIDVADITHVVNFSIPKVYDDYIHRIGRAGRAGQVGYALTFVAN